MARPHDSIRHVVKAIFLIHSTSKYETPKKMEADKEYNELKKVLHVDKIKSL